MGGVVHGFHQAHLQQLVNQGLNVLARHPLVEEFHDAPPDRGGWGATVAYLKDAPEVR